MPVSICSCILFIANPFSLFRLAALEMIQIPTLGITGSNNTNSYFIFDLIYLVYLHPSKNKQNLPLLIGLQSKVVERHGNKTKESGFNTLTLVPTSIAIIQESGFNTFNIF